MIMTISKINISDNKHDAVILLPSPFDVPVFPTPKLSFSPWLAWLRPVLLPARTFQLQKHICLLLSGIEIPLVLLQPKLCSCAVCALQKLTLVALAPRLAGPQTASPSPPLVPGRYPHNLLSSTTDVIHMQLSATNPASICMVTFQNLDQ